MTVVHSVGFKFIAIPWQQVGYKPSTTMLEQTLHERKDFKQNFYLVTLMKMNTLPRSEVATTDEWVE